MATIHPVPGVFPCDGLLLIRYILQRYPGSDCWEDSGAPPFHLQLPVSHRASVNLCKTQRVLSREGKAPPFPVTVLRLGPTPARRARPSRLRILPTLVRSPNPRRPSTISRKRPRLRLSHQVPWQTELCSRHPSTRGVVTPSPRLCRTPRRYLRRPQCWILLATPRRPPPWI